MPKEASSPASGWGSGSATAALVLQYMRASAAMRAVYRQTMPGTFTAELDAAVAEADEALAAAERESAETSSMAAAVFSELNLPETASADRAQDQRSRSLAVFETTLAQLIAEHLEDGVDGEECGEGGDPDDVMPVDGHGLAPADALALVLPTLSEFTLAATFVRLVATCRVHRNVATSGPHARAIWLGIAMREFGQAARAHLAAAGADGMLATDWRRFVVDTAVVQGATAREADR